MLQRVNRFHGRHSVSKVRGFLVHSKHLSFRVSRSNQKNFRLAVVVSKKVASSAVIRNRIRRRVFETIRTQGRLDNTPIDLIIYVKDDAVQRVDWTTLGDEIAQATKKALAGASKVPERGHRTGA